MKSSPPPESPDAYVRALRGWRRPLVEGLRECARSVAALEERIKWGHLVYACNGPVLLIRAEEERVLFGFWRGRQLRDLDRRLKPGGKYDMATIVFGEHDPMCAADATALIEAAVALNRTLGDPTATTGRR